MCRRESRSVVVAAAGPRADIEQSVRGRARLIWPEGSTRARLMNAGAKDRGRVRLPERRILEEEGDVGSASTTSTSE
jgi:hypothetical protein